MRLPINVPIILTAAFIALGFFANAQLASNPPETFAAPPVHTEFLPARDV